MNPENPKPTYTHQPIMKGESGLRKHGSKKRSKSKSKIKSPLFWFIIASLAVILALASLVWVYYRQLQPVDIGSTEVVTVEIKDGMSSNQIADILEQNQLIRSNWGFRAYVFINKSSGNLKAGSYSFSPSDSISDIVDKITSGTVNEFSLTFYPGATLTDINRDPNEPKYDVTTILKSAGYSDEEIVQALEADYDSPLLADRPEGADLEGYIYGDTYSFNVGTSAQAVLERTFDEFYQLIIDNNLLAAFDELGLDLHQAITLGSIIQREVGSLAGSSQPSQDQRQVAQIFLDRLSIDMILGSDVTYQYITDKLGVDRDVDFDSPYNTRRYQGLPPGPIAVPNITSLMAIANPAGTEYLYFLTGDDGEMYYGTTYEEHLQNVENHCQVSCSTL